MGAKTRSVARKVLHLNIEIHGRHIRVPPNVRDLITEKLEHLHRYMSSITNVDVELFRDGKLRNGGGYVVHVTVLASGPVFRSKVTSKDPLTAVDTAVTRLERSIKEFKRKRSGKPAHSRPKVISGAKLRAQADVEE